MVYFVIKIMNDEFIITYLTFFIESDITIDSVIYALDETSYIKTTNFNSNNFAQYLLHYSYTIIMVCS